MSIQLFDSWALNYDKSVVEADEQDEFPFAGYRRVMQHIYSRIVAINAANVLDLGIGTGNLCHALYQQGIDITGIDSSAKMLDIARQRMPHALLLQYDLGMGLPEEVGQQYYDAIISTYTLHHFADETKMQLLTQLKPLLSETGVVLIGDIMFSSTMDEHACRQRAGEFFDEDEYYLIFDRVKSELDRDWVAEYWSFSYCAGVIELRKR